MLRIIIDIILAATVLSGWWVVTIILGMVGSMIFPTFIECIFAGIFFDALYGFARGAGYSAYLGSAISLVIFLGTITLKQVIRR